jgi:xanthine dehydrogenase YagT iron-sulfur-binding subunit
MTMNHEKEVIADTGGLSRRDVLKGGTALGVLSVAGFGTQSLAQAAVPSLPMAFRTEVEVAFRINGAQTALALDPRSSLLDVLRDQLGLTGAKKGCDHGQCGACTVHVDGRRVAACMTLAVQVDDLDVTTIEGLAEGDVLHPMQQAFIDHDALQCGYCTPGQIMAGVACVREGHAGSPQQIREYMSGNLCRCGAYPGIVAAIEDAARVMEG